MSGPWRGRLASWNRYLALVGVALLLVGLAFLLVRVEGFPVGEVAVAAGAIFLLAAWLANPGTVRRALGSRSVRYGGVLALMSLSLLGILVLLNVLSYRHYLRWDLSEEGLFSLSPQTRRVLDRVDQPVQVTGFFYQGYDSAEKGARDRLQAYQAYSRRISYTSVDPERRPVLAEQYDIPLAGYALVVESGDRRQMILSYDEQSISAAILRVTLERTVTVYFLVGHGEGDIRNSAADGYSEVRGLLEEAGYRVEPLALAAYGGDLPVTDTVVVVPGPQSALLAEEEDRLSAYLERGGRALLLLDPAPAPDLGEVLGAWGVKAKDSWVVDPDYAWEGDATVLVIYAANPNHAISRNLPVTLFPGARPLGPLAEAPAGITYVPLLITSDSAWGEADPGEQPPAFDDAVDEPGPLALAVCLRGRVEGRDQPVETRVVVVGDADLARNGYQVGGNAQFFFNAVNWLAEEEELIEIAPIRPKQRQVVLDAGQTRIVRYATLVGLPLLVIGVGIGVWLRRRRG